MLIIAAAQPTCNSWDEQIHFRDSYRIASGHNVEWTEAGLNIMNRINHTMAVFAAPVASEYCHVLFYQPKEPEGFKEFLKKEQKKI